MKFILSTTVLEQAEGPLTVCVNNLNIHRGGARLQTNVRSPKEDQRIKQLNKLAATRPFCVTQKVKKYDPL
jgi:hypothetical protein